MLRTIKELESCIVSATDGDLGHVKDCYFDDESWVIRYFVVGTGEWLTNRQVLVSPLAVGEPTWSQQTIPVSITREQVKRSPDVDTNRPVSRQHELDYFGYYGYPYYWGGSGLWGDNAYPGTLLTGVGYDGFDGDYRNRRANAPTKDGGLKAADRHLRSCNAVGKYRLHASDGELGHVEGMLVDERTWSIRYLIVNTSNWWLGHSVIISPEWIEDVSWINERVSVDLTRQAIKDAPIYDSAVHLNREHELGIYRHYGRTGYWIEGAKHKVAS